VDIEDIFSECWARLKYPGAHRAQWTELWAQSSEHTGHRAQRTEHRAHRAQRTELWADSAGLVRVNRPVKWQCPLVNAVNHDHGTSHSFLLRINWHEYFQTLTIWLVKTNSLVFPSGDRHFSSWDSNNIEFPVILWQFDNQTCRQGSFQNITLKDFGQKCFSRSLIFTKLSLGLFDTSEREEIIFFIYTEKKHWNLWSFRMVRLLLDFSIQILHGHTESHSNPANRRKIPFVRSNCLWVVVTSNFIFRLFVFSVS
jgi:hypothetical protein